MSDKAFFDTNVLIYSIAEDDERAPRAESLLAEGGVISVQVLNEFASVSRRKLQMSWEEVREALAAIRVLCPSPASLTAETHDAALRLAARYGFRFYDALIAAAALEAGCTTLYSEDFQSGQSIEGRLIVVDPFAA